MKTFKYLLWLFFFSLVKINSANIYLFQTENALNTQTFDCIYYTNITAVNNETIPYCIRTKESMLLNRSFSINTCGNSGKEWSFKQLKEMNVSQDDILTWNSSIEMVDRYATYLVNKQDQFAHEKVCQCSNNTFGKFCEYEFMTLRNTFEDTIDYQFQLKEKYRNGSQLWGNITCYTALTDCYSGLRCLTWQNICDGKQQCIDGVDENDCEELEFNECEENEYRCEDGSCIVEQYWIDGEYDCTDKSDEQNMKVFSSHINLCPVLSSRLDCDEATAHFSYFACGDGQFVGDSLRISNQCYNYRDKMFFCEYSPVSFHIPNMWTLEDGHCVEKGWIETNFTDMGDVQKCVFYLKCQLTEGKNIGCNEALGNFRFLCEEKTINYPYGSFFKPYTHIQHEGPLLFPELSMKVLFNGSIKCADHQVHSLQNETFISWFSFTNHYPSDIIFCKDNQRQNMNNITLERDFLNAEKYSFFCKIAYRYISKYRVGNSRFDCFNGEDENHGPGCKMKQKHRLSCSNDVPLCLQVFNIGDDLLDCQTGIDEYIPQLNWRTRLLKCTSFDKADCQILRTYIESPFSLLKVINTKVLLFRQYCDTIWDTSMGFDESLCNVWKCPRDEYQCLSSHCIPVEDVLDQEIRDWHCPDASNLIGLFRIERLSKHNSRLMTDSQLQDIRNQFTTVENIIYSAFFRQYCNFTQQYGCILADVTDPLNFTENRPCINLAQIGDGIIDCYGGLDERNLLHCGNNTFQQRGFDFHCNDQECIPFDLHCIQRCSNRADSLLCDQFPDLRSPACKNFTRAQLCVSHLGKLCHSAIDAMYYCDEMRKVSSQRTLPYRYHRWSKTEPLIYLPVYPNLQDTSSFDGKKSQASTNISTNLQYVQHDEHNGKEGWICGRGVAIKRNETDKYQCFCPPSLYGEFCQYFTDRITIITSLYNIPSHIIEQPFDVIKILALLLSDDDIIDYYVFHLPVILSHDLNKKFRFYLIYQRPKILSKSYKIRFEAYHITIHTSMKLIAVWEYKIKFPFLPSYRLAQILKFEKQSTFVTKIHICNTANPCHHNSICYPIMNKINDTSAYYCYCNSNSYGKQCEHLLPVSSSLNCSKNARQYALSSTKLICLCPSHSYGPTCHINHTCVQQNPCIKNRGICYNNPDNITHDYICICDKKYFGIQCQLNSAVVNINFTDFSFLQFPSNYILSSIIQLCDFDNKTLDLIVHEKRVYQGLPSTITQIFHTNFYLPRLGILKLYHRQDLSNDYIANFKQPEYFLLYIIPNDISRMNLTSTINMSNYCPHTSITFQKNIFDISYLSELHEIDLNNDFNVSVMIFKYHLLCDIPYSLMCFHDDNYFCLCDEYNHAECSRYDLTLDECNGRCREGGQCIHGDLGNQKDFICLCPHCYYGSVCQHNTKLFSFTLETLVTNDLHSSSIFIQKLFSSLLIIIPIILFLIGVINNICCYTTFNRKKPLLVGTGHYLRTVSIINQFALLVFLLKLMHIVLSIKGYMIHLMLNTVLCKTLSYFVSCTIRMSYWLMCMVAIERVYVTWHIKGTWLKSPRIAKRIILTVLIGILSLNIHEAIYYQSIEDPKSSDNNNNSTWCVTSYPSIIAEYNQINIILNFILPLLINLLSTIILIILIMRKRITVQSKKDSKQNTLEIFQSYITLLKQNNELILAPLVTILPQLFSLPQFILSFTLACQEFTIDWQRYLLIISYFMTYLPQVLSYKLYVSPSTFYKTEFQATKFGKKIYQWRVFLLEKTTEH